MLPQAGGFTQSTWAQFQAENADRIVLTADEMDECRDLSRAVGAHPVAAELLKSPGHREVSLVWKDALSGLLCKARPDAFVKWDGYSTIVDLKTTRDASPRGFAREVAIHGYHLQAAWYLAGADVLSPVARRFVFVAVEKTPPYCVGLYELDSAALDAGSNSAQAAAAYNYVRNSIMNFGNSNRQQFVASPTWNIVPRVAVPGLAEAPGIYTK